MLFLYYSMLFFKKNMVMHAMFVVYMLFFVEKLNLIVSRDGANIRFLSKKARQIRKKVIIIFIKFIYVFIKNFLFLTHRIFYKYC